ncbi:MAG: GTP-binding protein [bacterium]|nr:GTP-binding protein [bacterium]
MVGRRGTGAARAPARPPRSRRGVRRGRGRGSVTHAERLTPSGRGAVAVVAVTGAGAAERVAALCTRPLPAPGTFAVTRLALGADELDEALVLVRGPEHVEVHLHGSPPLVDEVERLLGGATDDWTCVLEQRAWHALADAPCEAAARILLDQAGGALRAECKRLIAGCPEGELLGSVHELAERGRVARYLFEPARVVLAGGVNAGKSTLFNALLGERRATTSAEPGTTRDVLIERCQLGPWPIDLVDTAGERALVGGDARAAVEREGQARGRMLRDRADLVLWLCPFDDAAGAQAPPRAVLVRTQIDRAAPGSSGARGGISAVAEPDGAREHVLGLLRDAFALPVGEPWVPGAPVPFEAASARALAAAGSAAEARRAVAGLLPPPDAAHT